MGDHSSHGSASTHPSFLAAAGHNACSAVSPVRAISLQDGRQINQCSIGPTNLAGKLRVASVRWNLAGRLELLDLDVCRVDDWHAFTKLAVEMTPTIADIIFEQDRAVVRDQTGVRHAVVRWHAYTDRSYVKSQDDVMAAWGFVVLAEISAGRFLRLGHMGGHVQDMNSNPHFLGVGLAGNYTAEVSDIVWAVAWIMQMPCCAPFTVRYDCVSAAMVAMGTWQSTKEAKLITVAMTCYRLAVARREVDMKHGKGHYGQPWNEYANRVAAARTSEKLAPLAKPFFCAQLVNRSMNEAAWAVEALGDLFEDPALPPLRDGKLLISSADAPKLPPFDYGIDLQAAERQSGDTSASADCTHQAATWLRKKKKKKLFDIYVKLFQCNVLSLDPQCEEEGGLMKMERRSRPEWHIWT